MDYTNYIDNALATQAGQQAFQQNQAVGYTGPLKDNRRGSKPPVVGLAPISEGYEYQDCVTSGVMVSGNKPEAVNHPAHYGGDTTYEAIKVIEAWKLDFCLGNTVKYISRAGKKNPATKVEDLKKALWYLEREIKRNTKS